MNYQLRGVFSSVVIHLTFLFLVIGLNSSVGRFSRPLVIDFSIEDAGQKNTALAAAAPKTQNMKIRQPEPLKPEPSTRQEVVPSQAVQQPVALQEAAAGAQAPVAATMPVASGRPAEADSRQTSVSQTAVSSSATKTVGSEGMKQRYLAAHFAYIREIVQKKLSYPAIARKMGWEGKVILSFIVCPDGYVKDITIREGSGVELLDRNAIAAVQAASPFPRPPVEAQLIIPINYSLN